MPTSSRNDILITEACPALSSKAVSDVNMLEKQRLTHTRTAPATLCGLAHEWPKTLSAAPWLTKTHQVYNREYWINVAYTLGKHPQLGLLLGIRYTHTLFWDDVSGFLPVLSRQPNRFLDSTIRWFVISPSNIPMKSGLNLMVPFIRESSHPQTN